MTERIVYTKDFYIKVLVLAGLQFLVVVDGTVMALAIPAIKDDMGLTSSGRNWVISAYIIFFGGFMLLGGRLGDTFGRKKVFLFGVVLFSCMSALCGLALNEPSLIIFRALQGLGAAIAAPTAMALVTTSFPAGKMRNKAFAIYGGVSGIGSIAGLILGGFLVTLNWRLIFWINVPVGVLVLLGGVITLTEIQGSKQKLDVYGAVLVTLTSISIIYTLQQTVYGFWKWSTILGTILSILLGTLFLIVERKGVSNPIIPLHIFRNKDRVMALLSIFLCGGILTSLAYLVADFFQKVLGYQPSSSGLAVIPFAIGLVLAASISSRVVERFSPRWPVIVGSCLVAITCIFASENAVPDINYFPKLFLAIFVVGFGCGLSVIALSLSVVAGVRSTEIGPLTAFANVAQDLGGLLGLMFVTQAANIYLVNHGINIDSNTANYTTAQLDILAGGSRVSFICCAIIAVLVIFSAYAMKFTPDDIAEAKKVKQLSNESEIEI